MSGHSKWKNIAHKKAKVDAQRAKIFTKFGREIAIAIREGGGDVNSNSKLKDIIAKAKANNVPNDNINRMIEKYSNSTNNVNYETMMYEGYGPSGVAVIVETLTDNKNRTAGEMRHYFDKYGSGLGATGCVSWQFDKKGVIVMERQDHDEDETMMMAIECGASDFLADEEVYEIYTEAEDFSLILDELSQKGFDFLEAEVSLVPQNYITLENEDDIKKMEKLIEMLEENDDVQNIYHSWDE